MFDKFLDPWGLKRLEKLLKNQSGMHFPIVVLTGAGISKESGLGTFRDKNGMWENHKISDVASPEGLERNPQLVLDFYNLRRTELLGEAIKPNAAHIALAKLEEGIGEVSIITQNIDNLHERAGSEQVTHIHGNLLRNKCNKCHYTWDSREPMTLDQECSVCQTKAVRPDVVFFKETPYHMADVGLDLNHAKIFIAIGTSGVVYPAAQFVLHAKRNGAICIEINPNASANGSHFDLIIQKPASEAVPMLVDFLLGKL